MVGQRGQPAHRPGDAGVGGDQAARIGMQRVAEQRRRRSGLDDLAGIHDGKALAMLRRQPQIVGDEQQAGLAVALQLVDQLHDPRLGDDVERRGRLVGDNQVGLAGEGHGDQRALALAAGKLVRKAAEQVGRARQMDRIERGERAVPPRRLAVLAEPPEMFVELGAERQDRVERGHRVLGHEGDGVAEQAGALARRHGQQVAVEEGHAAAARCETFRQHAGDQAADHRLAGAGFADHADQLAPPNRQRDIAQHVDPPAAGLGGHVDVVEGEERHDRALSAAGAGRRRSGAGRRPAG